MNTTGALAGRIEAGQARFTLHIDRNPAKIADHPRKDVDHLFSNVKTAKKDLPGILGSNISLPLVLIQVSEVEQHSASVSTPLIDLCRHGAGDQFSNVCQVVAVLLVKR